MKKIIALLALFCASAFSATLNPIQLLNPSGSTSGQAIVSTGPSTAPAWSNVTASSLSPVAANTVIANATSGAASPTAFAMPSCSASGNVLQYISNTGITCASGYAQLASPTFTGTVTTAALTATGAITPNQTSGIVGTTTNNNANAGSIGEYATNTTSGTSLTTATTFNATSISLTAGDWDVSGIVRYNGGAGAAITSTLSGISTTSTTLGGFGSFLSLPATLSTTGATVVQEGPLTRISVASTTTVYLIGYCAFSGGTVTGDGYIRARRIR